MCFTLISCKQNVVIYSGFVIFRRVYFSSSDGKANVHLGWFGLKNNSSFLSGTKTCNWLLLGRHSLDGQGDPAPLNGGPEPARQGAYIYESYGESFRFIFKINTRSACLLYFTQRFYFNTVGQFVFNKQ